MKILAMNRLSLPAVAVIVLMGTSCITDRLSGQTVKETRNVSTVNSLRLTMSADVYLTQGDNQSVVVEADKDVMQYIETEAEGETLVIKNREGHWRNSGQIKIYITMKDLHEIRLSGSGSLINETPIASNELRIDLSGSGSVRINNLRNAASVAVTISGSGNIMLAGVNNDASLDVRISGSGSLKAEDLSVADVKVKISGSGSARVNAQKQLETNISGSGSVRYKGNPMVNAHASGSGRTSSL